MKYLAIILCVYMTLLSLMPCQDNDDMVVESSCATITNQKACNQNAQEICPPFCTCSCCSTARQLAAEPFLVVLKQTVVRNYPHYTIPVVKGRVLKILQPPQIG